MYYVGIIGTIEYSVNYIFSLVNWDNKKMIHFSLYIVYIAN